MKKRLFAILALLPLLAAGGGQYTIPGATGARVAAPSTINYGVTTIGGSTSAGGNAYFYCNLITTGSDALGYSMSSINIYGNGASSGNMQVGVYTPGGAGSTAKVASSSAGSYSTSPLQWWSYPITGTLAASTTYNICMSSSTVFNIYYAATGSTAFLSSGQTYGTWPSSVTFASLATFSLSLYVTVTPN